MVQRSQADREIDLAVAVVGRGLDLSDFDRDELRAAVFSCFYSLIVPAHVASPLAYRARAMQNAGRDWLRKSAVWARLNVVTRDGCVHVADTYEDPEPVEGLDAAMADAPHAELARRRFVDGASYASLAREYGVNRATIARRLAKWRTFMRRRLGE